MRLWCARCFKAPTGKITGISGGKKIVECECGGGIFRVLSNSPVTKSSQTAQEYRRLKNAR